MCDARRPIKPDDTWSQQNYVFDKNAILGAEIEDEQFFFPDDLRTEDGGRQGPFGQGPVGQLLQCIFRGCSKENQADSGRNWFRKSKIYFHYMET